MSSHDLKQLEEAVAQAKADVEFGNALERLRSNRDFKQVILEGYFKEEAIRLVHLKGSPHLQSPESQKSILTQIDAISSVSEYMSLALHRARQGSKLLEDADRMREEIAAEEME